MKLLYNNIFKYGLHDTKVNIITVKDNTINLFFNNGVYLINDSGKEMSQTSDCTMYIEVTNLDASKMWQHIEILKSRRRRISEIRFEQFVADVQKHGFSVLMGFYSPFCNTLLLKGYTPNGHYDVTISEINSIDYIFENER